MSFSTERKRFLFILKKRPVGGYGDPMAPANQGKLLSSGLHNSIKFMVDMLQAMGTPAEFVSVTDNNDIDREVTAYKPTHAVIEAFWVVPEKFDVLKRIHPNVSWIVRNHSKTEFLANEGMAFGWVIGYLARDIYVACNSEEETRDLQAIARSAGYSQDLVIYLPNYYPYVVETRYADKPLVYKSEANIGCFGAIRPLKNHMVQAVAAIDFADRMKVKLNFHINGTRIEGKADAILKNLRQLFEGLPRHTLVEHPWMEHDDFLDLLSTMDISLQASFSETFNIVMADSVKANVPSICSPQISWMPWLSKANPNDAGSITRKMCTIWYEGYIARRIRQCLQRWTLHWFNRKTARAWKYALDL